MNERSKKMMREQRQAIYDGLKNTFNLAVYEDEIAEDEEKALVESEYRCFVIQSGDFSGVTNTKRLSQIYNIYYFSENREDVDETTIDIVSTINPIKGMSFAGTRKDRLQIKDVDRFVDRITVSFRRVIPVECEVFS